MQSQNKSEVAALMATIQAGREASQRGLTGLAMVASHQVVRRVAQAHEQLGAAIGMDKANQVVDHILGDDLEAHAQESIANGELDWWSQTVMAHLQEFYEEIEKMPQLPAAGSTATTALHEAWMAQQDRTASLIHQAELCALWLVPNEISVKLDAIRKLAWSKVELPVTAQAQKGE